jgi:hypothetical protein
MEKAEENLRIGMLLKNASFALEARKDCQDNAERKH